MLAQILSCFIDKYLNILQYFVKGRSTPIILIQEKVDIVIFVLKFTYNIYSKEISIPLES